MNKNPDIYLLYEYSDKVSYTVKIRIILDSEIDADLLTRAAQEAIVRFPYFSVQAGLDEGQNYTLSHNGRPVAVLPETNRRIILGSDEVNGHLIAITYRRKSVWFNFSHTLCGAKGAFFWIKATLYLYMSKKYGPLTPPEDIKLPGTTVTEEEVFYPDVQTLPMNEPMTRYTGGGSRLSLMPFIKYIFNPFASKTYYYQLEIPAREFMEYAVSIDGSPNSVLMALMCKMEMKYFREKEGTCIAGRVAADYSGDIGAGKSYRDFIRFIYTRYGWEMKEKPIRELNMRARGALVSQNQPELSYERFRKINEAHRGIDEQPDLKSKKKYAAKNSTFRSDPMATISISYVGRIDFGQMEQHITGIYTVTDGHLMLEVNALKDRFCISFQLIDKDPKPMELFCKVLEEEKIPYRVSGQLVRYLPKVRLP